VFDDLVGSTGSAPSSQYWAVSPASMTYGIDSTTLGSVTPSAMPAGARWVFNDNPNVDNPNVRDSEYCGGRTVGKARWFDTLSGNDARRLVQIHALTKARQLARVVGSVYGTSSVANAVLPVQSGPARPGHRRRSQFNA
jgi:hypothetical protein